MLEGELWDWGGKGPLKEALGFWVAVPAFLLGTEGSQANLGLLAAVTTSQELKELNLSTCASKDCELSTAVTERQHCFLLFGFLSSFCCYY